MLQCDCILIYNARRNAALALELESSLPSPTSEQLRALTTNSQTEVVFTQREVASL